MVSPNMKTLELEQQNLIKMALGLGPHGIDPMVGVPNWDVDKPTSPKILLVDDDPMFCAAVKRKAKKLHLDITICKTLGDITTLPSNPNFDVAILDYFFGEELTAFQISHLFSPEVPVVLISNTEGRKLSGDSWPPEIRTFIHKSAGTDAILAEALLASHWEHLVPSISSKTTLPEVTGYQPAPWWLPLAAVLTAAGALTLLYFGVRAKNSSTMFEWDKAPIQPSSYYSSIIPEEVKSRV